MYEEYERESYRLLQHQIGQVPGERLPPQVPLPTLHPYYVPTCLRYISKVFLGGLVCEEIGRCKDHIEEIDV